MAAMVEGGGFGRFELVRRLRKGDHASVWKARDGEAEVILKVAVNTASNAAVVRETNVLRTLGRHDTIVSLSRPSSAIDGLEVLVLEVAPGDDLATLLCQSACGLPLESVRSCLTLLQTFFNKLAEKRVIHNDIKPSNIVVDASFRPTVIDFGAAFFLPGDPEDSFSHTLCYASPEQLTEGMIADARSDLWGLAVTLFEALTGELPFRAHDNVALKKAIVHESPQLGALVARSDLQGLHDFFLLALAKNREQRFQSIDSFVGRFLQNVSLSDRTRTERAKETSGSFPPLPQPPMVDLGPSVLPVDPAAARRTSRVVAPPAVHVEDNNDPPRLPPSDRIPRFPSDDDRPSKVFLSAVAPYFGFVVVCLVFIGGVYGGVLYFMKNPNGCDWTKWPPPPVPDAGPPPIPDPPECKEGEKKCAGLQVRICGKDNRWDAPVDCENHTTCNKGLHRCACTNGDYRDCDAPAKHVCKQGVWVTTNHCEVDRCFLATSKPICDPKDPTGTMLLTCTATPPTATDPEPRGMRTRAHCTGETPVCDEGECRACAPHQRVCVGTNAYHECEHGAYHPPITCEPGTLCFQGLCRLCVPGKSRCGDDGRLETCGLDGNQWIAKPCAIGEACQSTPSVAKCVHAEAPTASVSASAAPPQPSVAGCYDWFNGGMVRVLAEGTLKHETAEGVDPGHWTLTGPDQYRFEWSSGWDDELTLVGGIGGSLRGQNQRGDPVVGHGRACP